MTALLDRPNDYWVVTTVTDQIITSGNSRLNLDHWLRVKRARDLQAAVTVTSEPQRETA